MEQEQYERQVETESLRARLGEVKNEVSRNRELLFLHQFTDTAGAISPERHSERAILERTAEEVRQATRTVMNMTKSIERSLRPAREGDIVAVLRQRMEKAATRRDLRSIRRLRAELQEFKHTLVSKSNHTAALTGKAPTLVTISSPPSSFFSPPWKKERTESGEMKYGASAPKERSATVLATRQRRADEDGENAAPGTATAPRVAVPRVAVPALRLSARQPKNTPSKKVFIDRATKWSHLKAAALNMLAKQQEHYQHPQAEPGVTHTITSGQVVPNG